MIVSLTQILIYAKILKLGNNLFIQGVPILSVNIFRGDRGPIGKHCLF